MKKSFVFILSILLIDFAMAQPGDAQIKKDVGGTGSHVKSFQFTKATGTRQWNSSVGNWEYVRGILVVRTSPDYPEYDLEVRGDAVYQDMGGGKYSYRRFRVISNRYLGIPDPTIDEINTALSQDWKKFYRTLYQRIYKINEPLRFTEEPYFFWYNPNSVEVTLKNKVEFIASNVETKVADVVYKVRLYRKDPKAPWDNFVGGQEDSHEEYKEYSTQSIDYQKAERLRKQTLANTMGEEKAKAQLAALPENNLKPFSNAIALATYVHKILHSGNKDQLRSVLMQTLAPHHFVGDSKVQLNDRAKDIVEKTIAAAYEMDGTYAQQYCATPNIDSRRSNDSHIYITAGMPNQTTLISCMQAKGGYVNGVAQMLWKITNIQVDIRQDQDALDYYASFTDNSAMCTGAIEKGPASTGSTPSPDKAEPKPSANGKKQVESLKGKLKGLIKQ